MKLIVKESNNATVSISENHIADIEYKTITVKFYRPTIQTQPLKLEWMFYADDIYSTWSPVIRMERSINPNWNKKQTDSKLHSGAPLHALVSSKGKNRLCIAVSDSITPIRISTGICEEQAAVECTLEIFTQTGTFPISEYSVILRLDTRDIAYEDSIRDAVAWWENACGYKATYIPDSALLPLDSLWYSFHQNLSTDEIIKECEQAKLLGMKSVIIDDGWQTDDNNRGYAHCGDWNTSKNKIQDMRELTEQIHALDMKVILWFSVPYMGIYSKSYSKFSHMLLNGSDPDETVFILDPRYGQVREYLTNIYEKAVLDWDLDGLKLDFLDSFYLTEKSKLPDPKRDTESLEMAIDMLMEDILHRLRAIKQDILIEFRHSYIGPGMRRYGNILRVTDCPMDALKNRGDIINLRLTSGNTAVHSDMLMWNNEASVETAALQLCCVLYSVPQISMRLDQLSQEHKNMIHFYLGFWLTYRDVLLNGQLYANNPESNYSLVWAEKDGIAVYTAYTNPVISCTYKKTVAVNATMSDMLILMHAENKCYRVLDCLGNELKRGIVESPLFNVDVPTAGIIFVEQ